VIVRVNVSSVFYFQYFGKLLFWIFMSSVPDAPADTVIGRAIDSRQEATVVERVAREMRDNVREMIDTNVWWD
jgi:hypothetical protein